MLGKSETTPIPTEKSDNKTLRAYFFEILPEHDIDKVHISDIKKIIKWFNFMKANDLLKEAVAKIDETKVEEPIVENKVADETISEKTVAEKPIVEEVEVLK